MQNKFGFHMCKDYSDQQPEHAQVYIETTVENIGMVNYEAETVQKTTMFDLETETVVGEEDPV